MACAIAWWSAAQALTAVCGGVAGFAAVRSLLGVGEAANFPGAAKAVSQWFPPRERSMATGVINVGSGIGQMIAAPVVAVLILRWNWRVAFAATGIVGFLWLSLWMLAYREPAHHPWLSSDERRRIREETEKEAVPERPSRSKGVGDAEVWTVVLGARKFWGLATARFFSEPAWQFFTYWIPLYLATERHLKLKEIAVFAWLPFLAGDLGSLVGGALGPLFMRLGVSVIRARKLSALTCASLMVLAIFIGSAPSAGWAIFFFCVGAFAHQAMSATLLTLPADLFPERAVATANGLSGMAGGIGGMLFTGLVGIAVQHTGYAPLFVAIALFDLVGSTVLWVAVREPRREAGKEEMQCP
jgi:ACS family hexuronate transporter-like MFS transporter